MNVLRHARHYIKTALTHGVLVALILFGVGASSVRAADQIYFTAQTNVTDLIIQRINAETVRLDISAWYLTEHAISIAIANKFNNGNGVPVRLIGDRGSIFEIDANTRREFYWLASQGVPIRLRYNPTWFPEINHWKMGIFVGQGVVEFGSANWTAFELAPFPGNNVNDNTAMFTDDPALVAAFKAKFDQIWNDTITEPQSIAGGPPYLMDWDDACDRETVCIDPVEGYRAPQNYPNAQRVFPNRARLEPNASTPRDLIWGQGPEFNNRLVEEINAEQSLVQFVIYRLTVDNITQALLNKRQSGVPVRLIAEPNEYRNRKWPEFWLTHANLDRLWAAGIPIRWRIHQGLTHMKTLVTSSYATNASSNYAAAWQRDHNYFVPAATKPSIYSAIKSRVEAMWNDTVGFAPFQPEPPDTPNLASPLSGATAVPSPTPLVWNIAPFATSYDVYLGTSQSDMAFVANVPAQLVNNPPSTYSWTPPPLQGGTTYFWRVRSRTFANLFADSSIWSFTTAGSAGGGGGGGGGGGAIPSPWRSQDVGNVGLAGSESFSNGTFTVRGAGANIWGTSDGFRYVYQPVSGDVALWARVTSVQNTNQFAKAGVMLRESLAPNAAHVVMDIRPNGAIEFMTRSSTGAETTYLAGSTHQFPVSLGLVRNGNTVSGYISTDGTTWTLLRSTSLNIGPSTVAGMVVASINTNVLNTSTFIDANVLPLSPQPPPPPPPAAKNVVIYASDPGVALHGSWSAIGSSTSPNGIALGTPDNGVANLNAPLASPADYVDVSFNADAGTQYRVWLRLQATANSKFNDAVWVQFSDASGSPAYRISTDSGLLVNLATDSTGSSLNGWGWQNTAYWLSQPTVVTFASSGTHTMRIQIREDGVRLDQIVLSPAEFLNAAPGPPTGDSKIVPKP